MKPKPVSVKPLAARIEAAAWAALGLRISNIPLEPMFCLKFARRVIETALGIADGGFYRLVTGVDANPSAAELEELLRKQKPSWVVTNPLAGDLVFWHDLPKPWGHVGVLVTFKGALWVAQNTTITNKGIDYPGALRLILLFEMPVPTTFVRIAG